VASAASSPPPASSPACAGADIKPSSTSKQDLAKVQAQFKARRPESGLSANQISRLWAMSIGDSFDTAILRLRAGLAG
jgi:hypothetical protein